jgi:hypothetical protein
MRAPDFPTTRAKRVAEKYRLSIDFVDLIEDGDTPETAAAAVYDEDGADVSVAMLAASQLVGTKIVSVVQAGVPGCLYSLVATLTTNEGDIFQGVASIGVRL